MADGMLQGHDNARLYRAFRREGKLFIAGSNAQIFRVDDDGDRLTPVTGFHLQARHYEKHLRGPLKEWMEQGKQSYLWIDADGDGRAQRGEVQYSGAGPWICLPHWDANGMYAVVGKAVQHWPITSVNSAGSPVLGEFPAGKTLLKLPPRVKSIEPRWASYITADPQGGWYVAINDSMKNWGHSSDSFLIAYNADGTQRWITPGKTGGTPQSHLAPGEIGCFRRIAGTTHGFRILGNGRVARVTGEIEAYQTGWHAFSADVYPPKTRYRIAGVELGRYSFNEVYMEAGKRYPVEIVYDAEQTHPTTNQGIRLKWATPRGTWPGAITSIPVSQLYAPQPGAK
jgi:hypothetical protein